MNFTDLLSIASVNEQNAAKLTSEKRFSTDLPKAKKTEKQRKEVKSEFLKNIEAEKEKAKKRKIEEAKRKEREEIAKNKFRIPKKIQNTQNGADASKSDSKSETDREETSKTKDRSKTGSDKPRSSETKPKSKDTTSKKTDSGASGSDKKSESDNRNSHSSSSKSKSEHSSDGKSKSSEHTKSSSSSKKGEHKGSSKHKSHKSSNDKKSENKISVDSKESKNNGDAKTSSETLPMSVRNNLHDTSSDRTAHIFSAGLKHIERTSLTANSQSEKSSQMTDKERIQKALQEKLNRVKEHITKESSKSTAKRTRTSTCKEKVTESPNKQSVKSKEFISDKDDEMILSKPVPVFEKTDKDPSKRLAFESNSADLLIDPNDLLVRSTDFAAKSQEKTPKVKHKEPKSKHKELKHKHKELKQVREKAERKEKHRHKDKSSHKHKDSLKHANSSKSTSLNKPVKHIVKPNNRFHAKPMDFKALMALASQKHSEPPPQMPVQKQVQPKKKEVEERPMTQEEKDRIARKQTKEYKDWYEKGVSPKKESEFSSNAPQSVAKQRDSGRQSDLAKKIPSSSKGESFKVPQKVPQVSSNRENKQPIAANTTSKIGSRDNKPVQSKNGTVHSRSGKYEEHENLLVCKPSHETPPVKKADTYSNPFDRIYGEIKKNKPPPPDLKRKRQVIESDSDSEYDSEMDDFIDDEPLPDADFVSNSIRDIFGYDKRKYRHIDEDDDYNMEASFKDIMKEEAVSTRIGKQEDLEDMKREEEEERMKKMRMKMKMKKAKQR